MENYFGQMDKGLHVLVYRGKTVKQFGYNS